MTVIHLIFKTHLDIGFTDYSANVIRTYYERFIPQAVALARRTREREQRFRWTTGAWLIDSYLEQASTEGRRAMEDAIAAGDIRWHGLPFTTHSELIDESLWAYGLSLAHKLDQRFGQQTIAAKLTDVPGHTRALVPLLAGAGIRLLHIGVNPASSVPDVPPVFLWRDEASGTDVVVIYDGTYGGLTRIAGLDDALALVLTGDNEGPPSDDSIAAAYATLAARVPGAQVAASTLDDFARALEPVRDRLPVVTSEIGDTWIHGAGADPTKISQYRELARLRRAWLGRELDDPERAAVDRFSERLILIPEHTWGMDEKTHLHDYTHYLPAQLAELRQTEASQRFEASWTEQRGYLTQALAALPASLQQEAQARLSAIAPRRPEIGAAAPTPTRLQNERCTVDFDPLTGAVIGLSDTQSGAIWADSAHPLALPGYEVFGLEDYDRFWEQYIRNKDDEDVGWWGREDFTKPGLPLAHGQRWQPQVTAVVQPDAARLIFTLAWPDAARQFGAPAAAYLDYTLTAASLDLTYSWFGKPANRIAEAFWLTFQPRTGDTADWRFEKIGRLIDPTDVVSRGARTLHAIDQQVICRDGARTLTLTTLDAPLVAPGHPALLNFHNQPPELSGGVHVNLYNNVWGTNFPMWFDDDAQFRFQLRLS